MENFEFNETNIIEDMKRYGSQNTKSYINSINNIGKLNSDKEIVSGFKDSSYKRQTNGLLITRMN